MRKAPCEEKRVWLAKELIDYPPELEAAMSFVFGNTLICPDLNSAKRVCYDQSVMTRTVTLDGEDLNPAGVLHGGTIAF